MILAVACLRWLRADLHRQAYEKHRQGLAEAAQALWGVVESIDALLIRLNTRRR